MGAGNVDVEGLGGGADAADDFAGPKRWAKERDPAIFEVADGAEKVALVSGLVGVDPALREVAFKGCVRRFRGGAGAYAEGFVLEAFEQLEELGLTGLRQDEAAAGSFAVVDFSRFTKFLNAIDVAEEVDDVMLVVGESGEDSRPNFGGLLAANRFAVLGLDEFETNGFDAVAEVHGFDIQRKGRKLERIRRRAGRKTHSMDSA